MSRGPRGQTPIRDTFGTHLRIVSVLRNKNPLLRLLSGSPNRLRRRQHHLSVRHAAGTVSGSSTLPGTRLVRPMERAVEERKPRREGGRHHWVIKSRQNRLARACSLEEKNDLALREEDRPAIDGLGDDRLATVGEELLCAFALAGLEASYKNDPIDGAHAGQSRRLNSTRRKCPLWAADALLAFLRRRSWF